jgi:hypothetical protein
MVVVATICSINGTYTIQTAGNIYFHHKRKNMFEVHVVISRINHQQWKFGCEMQFELFYVLDPVNLSLILHAFSTVTTYTGYLVEIIYGRYKLKVIFQILFWSVVMFRPAS